MKHVIIILLGWTAIAYADPKKPDPAETAYQDGLKHYELREWDDAISSFKESYRLRGDERSLFDIAQAYRLAGKCSDAVGFYKTYKRKFPDNEAITVVDGWLDKLQPCPASEPAPPPPPIDTAPTPRVEARPAPGHGKRIAGIVIGSAGVLATAGAVLFALHAQDLAHQVEVGMGTFDHQLQDDGQAANTNAEILFAVGGAAVVTGVVLYVMGRPHDTVHVAVAPTPHGGTILWRASF